MQQFQSTIISTDSGKHPYVQLAAPAEGRTGTLACLSCTPHQTHTLVTGDGSLLVLTDDYVQVFRPGREGVGLIWTQSLLLDVDCNPLYIQESYGIPGYFLVVCATDSSFGYQSMSSASSGEVWQLRPLDVLATNISGLIFGGYWASYLQQNTDAFIYIREGELNFGLIADALPAQTIYIDGKTLCAQKTVVDIYPLPIPTNGKARFVMDCRHASTNILLRYKLTLFLENPSYVETAHLLPQTFLSGALISSPDSKYFVIVQTSNIVAVQTEEIGTYRVRTLEYPAREVAFLPSQTSMLAIVSPGQNHKVVMVDTFIREDMGFVELPDSSASCPNMSNCLPFGMAATESGLDIFYTFTATQPQESSGYFHLKFFDIRHPGKAILKVENLALQPAIAFARGISIVNVSSTAVHQTASPSPTPSSDSTWPLTSTPVHNGRSSASTPVIIATHIASNDPTAATELNTGDGNTGLTIGITVVIIIGVLAGAIIVLVIILAVIRKYRHEELTMSDQEKTCTAGRIYPKSVVDTQKMLTPVNATGTFETADGSKPNPAVHQLVTPVTINLPPTQSMDTLSSRSSGVSSATQTPSTSSVSLHEIEGSS